MEDKENKKNIITITTEEGTFSSMNIDYDETIQPNKKNISEKIKNIKNI